MRTDGMSAPTRKPTLRLFDYYLIEGMSSFAATIFLLGIYFWARARYNFSNTENLALGALQGLGHMVSSRLCGRLGDRWGYNRLLVLGISLIALISLTGWIPEARWLPFVVITLYSSAIAITWPALEGGAMHLPGSINMPQRLGIYNLVWSFAGAIGFALSGFIFEWKVDAIFWIPGLVHVAQLVWILTQRGRHVIDGSAAMDFPHVGDHQSPEVKKQLTSMAWLSNSLGYFLIGGFAALTPHLGERLGLSPFWTIWLGASLLAARAIGFIVLYAWNGWHYQRSWSHYALWSAPIYLALIFFTHHLAVTAAACLLLGFSLGLSYYMSIYYSLDASDHKGEQGGLHEALIGLGILTGPLAGAIGGLATGTTYGAKITIIVSALLIAVAGWMRVRRL
jgi:hypothetical protein